MDDEIARIKAELAGLSNEARALPLVRLSQRLWNAYWRAGSGSLSALPHLLEAVEALEEARGYLAPGDTVQILATAMLGVSRSVRHMGHDGPAADRDEGIRLIEEALSWSGRLPPVTADFARVTLGQAYLRRTMGVFHSQSHDFLLAMLRDGAPAGALADLDRAIDCFREVIAVTTQPEMVEGARTLLTMAEAMRTMLGSFGSPSLGTQMSAMMQLMTTLQELERDGFGMTIRPPDASIFDTEWTSRVDPTDWPVAMFQDPASDEERSPRERPTLEADIDAMRVELRELLDGDGDLYVVATGLLRTEEPPEWIDDFVARAAGIVHSAEPASGMDHFLLGVALHLRGRRDDGGWAEDDDAAAGDAQAAVVSLLAAAETIPDDDPDGIPALIHLAILSPEGALTDLAARLAPLTAILRAVGAETLCFPEPVIALRWNVKDSRIEAADTPGGVRTVVVVGDGRLPAVESEEGAEPSATEDEPLVSHVASISQLRDLSRRAVRPVMEEPVFVANPRGDRESATVETMLLRRSFYPRSAGLGRLIEDADGAGTRDEVRARLDASLLHLACGVTAAGVLELAGADELDLAGVSVARGGLAILPPDHFLPLADLLLAAGFTGVVGWSRPVPEVVAALAVFVLHAELAERGRTPAEAVREVRRWFRNPDREMLPPLLARYAEQLDGVRPDDWGALVYRGM